MENKRLHFYIQCRPCTATAQERKAYCSAGRVIFYDPPNVKAMKQTLRAYLKPFVPEEPYCCPVRLAVQWRFSYSRGHHDGDYRLTRPDVDNLLKSMQDIMTELGYWKDDSLVVELFAQKIWHKAKPGYCFTITPLEEEKWRERRKETEESGCAL